MKILKLICLMLVLCVISSCGMKKRINVSSNDYPNIKYLEADEFDYEKAKAWIYIEENPYINESCFVSVENNQLIIQNKEVDIASDLMAGDNGYFVGVDLGEFDGWVKYYPYYSTYPEVPAPELVVAENFSFFIQLDNQKGYLFTYTVNSDFTGYEGSLHLLVCPSKKERWRWEKLTTFEGIPIAYVQSEDDVFYIATTSSILKLDSNGTLNTVTDSEIISKIYVNSMVILEEKLYLGSAMGVFSYDLKTGEETWYPMDYEAFLQ